MGPTGCCHDRCEVRGTYKSKKLKIERSKDDSKVKTYQSCVACHLVFVTFDKFFAGGFAGEAAGGNGRRSAKDRKGNAEKGDRQGHQAAETANFLAV